MRTSHEIYKEIDKANKRETQGTGFSGMTYEEGVKNALHWIMRDIEYGPMDD